MESKEKEIQNSVLKLTICLFLFFLCLMFSLLWKYLLQLVGKYASFFFCFCVTFSLATGSLQGLHYMRGVWSVAILKYLAILSLC